MTIIKLRTKRPVLHPQLTDCLHLDRARLEMEATWFGVVVKQPGVEHPIIIPWGNVLEVVVDSAEEFMADVIAPSPPVWMPKVTEPGDSLERAAASDPPKKPRAKK